MTLTPAAVLIHGMGRTARSMSSLQRLLKRQGYQVHSVSYPSAQSPMANLCQDYIAPVLTPLASQGEPIFIVTHSLGGILLRHYLQHHALPKGSRAVMLAPPNHGSEVADKLKLFRPYRWFTGPVGQQLGTGPGSPLQHFKAIDIELGIIAGTRSSDPWFNHLFTGPHDGKVSVKSCRLPEMKDFAEVKAGHTFIMNHSIVQRNIISFFNKGVFNSVLR
ncbi:esterase/lipase family protein [Motilimonas pumila]|uniref:Alpha/beta fold hydrolase n=1 Tax=Motilimonas pumila TaxID=2303987 RepID=A0A418YBE4_9GAMM|nr:alpha/beta fold hydrolase [Motilimonas pumila]RJG40302.1 alpha/beta fold hydrolase [Motilimonas pumila]